MATETQKLPLKTLRNFVPLRNFDAGTISSLSCRIETYPPEAVIFNLGRKAESIPYLLEGEVEMQPDSDGRYLVSAGSVGAPAIEQRQKIRRNGSGRQRLKFSMWPGT